jgi:hypothetical protein
LPEEKINEELDKWAKLQEVKTKTRSSAKKPKDEIVSQEKANKEEVESIEESTAEVKGATSDNDSSEKE